MKRNIYKLVVAGVAMMTLFCGCGKAKQISIPVQETKALDESKDERYVEMERKLDEIDQVLDKYYLNEDEIDSDAMMDGIMHGYISGLNEKYTKYYSQEEFKSLMEDNNGVYAGIGMMVSQNVNTKLITVITVFEGSPAEEVGMKREDILYKVEGEEIGGQDVNLVISKIKGEPGTKVNLTVYRPSEEQYIDLEVERRQIEVPTVSHEMLENQLGYIYVSSFDAITVSQFSEAIDDLTQQGMKGLILDLRYNPGGLLTSACAMLDRILPEDQLIVYTVDKNDVKEEEFTHNPDKLDVPMVLLVNGHSASASEVFTGAIKDYEKATIIGTTTYGKGIVQVLIPLSDGSAVTVTQSRYYSPKGICIHGTGIEPDITVEQNPESDEDTQLVTAIDTLKSMIK